jgi:hypothetical protein
MSLVSNFKCTICAIPFVQEHVAGYAQRQAWGLTLTSFTNLGLLLLTAMQHISVFRKLGELQVFKIEGGPQEP